MDNPFDFRKVTPDERWDFILRALKPRTIRERITCEALIQCPTTTVYEVLKMSKSDEWRSKTDWFRGHPVCSECRQLLSTGHCGECGTPVGSQITPLDLIELPTDKRIHLEKIAHDLLNANLDSNLILQFLNWFNSKCDPWFLPLDVAIIFESAVDAKLAQAGKG